MTLNIAINGRNIRTIGIINCGPTTEREGHNLGGRRHYRWETVGEEPRRMGTLIHARRDGATMLAHKVLLEVALDDAMTGRRFEP